MRVDQSNRPHASLVQLTLNFFYTNIIFIGSFSLIYSGFLATKQSPDLKQTRQDIKRVRSKPINIAYSKEKTMEN